MKKLIAQILKFGIVGVICFLIEFAIYTIFNVIFRKVGLAERFAFYYLISNFIAFVVSMITNYILSMKYVFVRKDDMSRRREFIIFFTLSVIGLGINELILFIGMDLVYQNWPWLRSWMHVTIAETLFKCFATGVVMVYNFITRKIFLEKKEET